MPKEQTKVPKTSCLYHGRRNKSSKTSLNMTKTKPEIGNEKWYGFRKILLETQIYMVSNVSQIYVYTHTQHKQQHI